MSDTRKIEQFMLDVMRGDAQAQQAALIGAAMSIADSLETITAQLSIMREHTQQIAANGDDTEQLARIAHSALKLMTFPPHLRDRCEVLPNGGVILPERLPLPRK